MSGKRRPLLLIGSDRSLQRRLSRMLDGFEVHCAGARADVLESLRRYRPAVILLDLGSSSAVMETEEGFATLAAMHHAAPRSQIIVLGRGSREHALRAIALGACDFCDMPVDRALLPALATRAARLYDMETDIARAAAARYAPAAALEGIVAASASMLATRRSIEKIAPTPTTVLLLGETGTGKERLARALHALSPRAGKPLVAVNCAAIPEGLLESELFGHERGAFTGATTRKIGRIERANRGTLLLDEIGDMPIGLQGKLLRFLQERAIERVGGHRGIPVDVRVIAATNQRLDAAIARGAFRSDLFYRISEVVVPIPPLRERGLDVVLLANHFLEEATRQASAHRLRFGPEAIAAIEAHSWPGNVRELRNCVNRGAFMTEGKVITAADLGLASAPVSAEVLSLRASRLRAEMEAIDRALARADGNVSKAAELLGTTRQTLYDIMHRAQRA